MKATARPLGRPGAFSAPMQQRAAKALLQAPDLLAHGRLGAMDALTSTGNPARIHNRDKAAEQIEVEHRCDECRRFRCALSPLLPLRPAFARLRTTAASCCVQSSVWQHRQRHLMVQPTVEVWGETAQPWVQLDGSREFVERNPRLAP
jgi:hypothetical protein